MYINDQILNLIVKKLKGEATAEELHQLQLWTLADSAHRHAYDELLQIWKESGPLLHAPLFDARAAWNTLEQRIAACAQANKPSPVRYIQRLAAAAVVMAAALTAWYMWSNRHVSMQTIYAANSTRLVQMPDSSLVWLRKGSTIEYAASFNGRERVVKLSGEAFFDIRHHENQPFVINTLHTQVKVLGTAFMVHTAQKSDEIIVTRGKVLVTDREKTGNEIILAAGQQVTITDHHLQRMAVTDSNYISWKTGLLNFKEAALAKVLRDVADYYNVLITVPDSEQAEAGTLHITVRFEGQSLTQVLDEIHLITGWNMRKEKDKIIFYKNNAVFK